jgi:release factor H-coupled RctB family protein
MTTITETDVRFITSANSWIESEAVRQVYATARLDGMRLAVGFPDLHPGKGHPVGAAFVSTETIYPYVIGGDIGCGMGLWKTDLARRKAKLDRWTGLRFDLEHPWEGNGQGWLESHGVDSTQFDPFIGTIGGGNHFAELQAVEKIHDDVRFEALDLSKENLLLLVHSGSRGLGVAILGGHVLKYQANGVEAESMGGAEYLDGHDLAVRWARANRALIAHRFLATLGAEGEPVRDAAHNSISRTEHEGETLWIHRKGATPSNGGAVVIPGSRGTLSYLVKPTGDGASHAWSVAHGAGRKWSRSESRSRTRERFRPEQLVQTSLGGRVVCADRDLLYEEAPTAYKNIEVVIQDLVDAGLVTVIATLRPVFTYKTGTHRIHGWRSTAR